MKLNERLRIKEAEIEATAGNRSASLTKDPFSAIKGRAQSALFAKLGAKLYDSGLTEGSLQELVVQELSAILDAESAPLTEQERANLVAQIRDDILGYGPIQMFLDDPTVTEIMVNGTSMIYVERDGKIVETDTRFATEVHLRRVIERIVGQVGRRIDESSPMVDARLPDGSRVNAIIPPLSVDGPTLTVRVFAKDPFGAEDLIDLGTMSKETSGLLEACVRGRLNVIVSGGTGTGKTTMLNVLSSFIPPDQRIITVEDSVELQLLQRHVIRLESRPPNIEGRGEISIRDLVKNALRMRPDRIVVGEVRGTEALDMLQAMNTGHEGSLSTVHSNTPRDALSRLETMVLMAGVDLPSRAIREQISSAIDVIIHLSRLSDGSRRITQVSEVVGMEGDVITLQDIFTFDYAAGLDQDRRFVGGIRPTGIRPQFTDRLHDVGVELPPSLFGTPELSLALNGKKRRS